ncbi:hypothetical protein CUPS3778_09135 [Campylobacter upsaliensis]|uniref:hypothetical protein n=1 Tax=Campylobacter upsaliensis TaxID=28080 RepID=UPI002149D69D|nr:hypothetical protein [Campylobacter upsaliensis]MCR2125188.1 hypothetical protein [Campylobacter upsaliensis]
MTYRLFIKVINEKTGREKMIDTKAYSLLDIQKIIDVYKAGGWKLKAFSFKNFNTKESEI